MGKPLPTITIPMPDGRSVNAQQATIWATYVIEEGGERKLALALGDEQGRAICHRWNWTELSEFMKHMTQRSIELDPR